MNWHYLLLVNFYLVLFFSFYALLLRKETFFQLNRVFLVTACLLSFFIPIMQLSWVENLFITQQLQNTMMSYTSPVINIGDINPAEETISIIQILGGLYITGCIVVLIRFIWQLIQLKKIINHPAPSAAYSFFKKITLGKSLSNNDVIARHEQVHARQWHSADVLLIELVLIINWFNPIVYLYRFAIKYTHEFIADRQIVQTGTDKTDYALLLVGQTFDIPAHHLLTPFYNHSLLKQRIIMLQKNKSQRTALLKYGLSAPLFVLMLILSSATVSNFQKPNTPVPVSKKSQKPPRPTSPIAKNKDPKNGVYEVVEVLPKFPGGNQSFFKYLSQNIKYPAIDRENNIQGKVYVQFVVEKNGTLSNIKALHSPSAGMSAEAVRVVSQSPKWNPGLQNGKVVRARYTIPISFTLQKG